MTEIAVTGTSGTGIALSTRRRFSWRVVQEPTTEPLTLEEARLHLRVTADEGSPPSHPDDPLILALITAARQFCENSLGRALAPQLIELTLDSFPSGTVQEIQLPMSPVISISSLGYTDSDSVEQTLDSSSYVLDNAQEPGWLLPLVATEWPATGGTANLVRIRYWAGYTNPNESPDDRPIPKTIRQAMLLLIGHWYENREAVNIGNITSVLDFAVDALLKPYQLRLSMA